MSPTLDRPKKYFLEKLKMFSTIKVEAKFACGSNGSTPSLCKSLPEAPEPRAFYFPVIREQTWDIGNQLSEITLWYYTINAIRISEKK